MHSILNTGLMLCFTAVAIAAEPPGAAEAKLPDQPKDYAALVTPKLPKGWTCTYDFETLIISHPEPVTLLNGISLPYGEHNEKFFKEHGVQTPYLVVLKFIPLLTAQEQRDLVNQRQQALDEAAKGRERTKDRGAKKVYEQHFIPEYYNYRFSIDLHQSDTWPLQLVAPASVVAERDEIMKLLQANLKKYPSQP